MVRQLASKQITECLSSRKISSMEKSISFPMLLQVSWKEFKFSLMQSGEGALFKRENSFFTACGGSLNFLRESAECKHVEIYEVAS